MPTQTFIADSAADAIGQIRAQLGADAVVLNVRQLPASGLSRLWQKPRIEVLAHVPDKTSPPAAPDGFAELRRELADIRARMDTVPAAPVSLPTAEPVPREVGVAPPSLSPATGASDLTWPVAQLLEQTGLARLPVQRIVDAMMAEHGPLPPPSLAAQIALARRAMTRMWRSAPELPAQPERPHVFLGAAGSGKTTALCKWLAQAVLVEGRTAHVWRLDGATANTAETLSVYGEILGVPVSRFWRGTGEAAAAGISFVDLPGVSWRNVAALAELNRQVLSLGSPHLHLVLNAAYEVPLLLAQARAFAALPLTDVIVTHLDEEPRWGKLWNLALGTNLPIRFLSAGQNVPGDFHPASPEKIFATQFASK
ncbi:MAG TPA: hypothetical protein VMB21_07645 [Candidatus Limnocylindria bacterium]|nr:hypothetical protein [Candidatus Limnocylindria bacterium]